MSVLSVWKCLVGVNDGSAGEQGAKQEREREL